MTLLQALSKFTTSLKVDHRDRSPARMWLGRVKRGTSDRFNCEPPLVTVYASSNLPRFFFLFSLFFFTEICWFAYVHDYKNAYSRVFLRYFFCLVSGIHRSTLYRTNFVERARKVIRAWNFSVRFWSFGRGKANVRGFEKINAINGR